MSDKLDLNEAALARIHGARLVRRDIDQLLGICEFALQDGVVDRSEAEAILEWLNRHRSCLDTWPASVLYDRLRAVLKDGVVDGDEQRELLSLVMRISRPANEQGDRAASHLPVDNPVPPIDFEGRRFCLTGVFDYGSRDECKAAIEERGGLITGSVSKKLDYLVIGNVGSDAWLHASFGTKIAKAVEYRDAGAPIKILAENDWVAALVR